MAFGKDAARSNALNNRDNGLVRPAHLPRQSSYSKRHSSFDTPREIPFPSQSQSLLTASGTAGVAGVAGSKSPSRRGVYFSERSGGGRIDGHEDTADAAVARIAIPSPSAKSSGMPSYEDDETSPSAQAIRRCERQQTDDDISDLSGTLVDHDHDWHSDHLHPPLLRGPVHDMQSPSQPFTELIASPPMPLSASFSSPSNWEHIQTMMKASAASARRPSTESLPLPSQTPIHALPSTDVTFQDPVVESPELEAAMDTDKPSMHDGHTNTSPPPRSSTLSMTSAETKSPVQASMSPPADQYPPALRTHSSPDFGILSSALHQRLADTRPRPLSDHSISSSSQSTSSPSIPPPSPPLIHTPPPLDDDLDPVGPEVAHDTASTGSKRKKAPHEPFLSHAPPPVDSFITVETLQQEYRLIVRLPGYKQDCITIATRRRRILHIVADNWDAGGGHFERRISFGYDADLSQVRAEFDGLHLRVVIPRRIPRVSWFGAPVS